MRETRGDLKGMIAEVQKGVALFLSCNSSVRNLQNVISNIALGLSKKDVKICICVKSI